MWTHGSESKVSSKSWCCGVAIEACSSQHHCGRVSPLACWAHPQGPGPLPSPPYDVAWSTGRHGGVKGMARDGHAESLNVAFWRQSRWRFVRDAASGSVGRWQLNQWFGVRAPMQPLSQPPSTALQPSSLCRQTSAGLKQVAVVRHGRTGPRLEGQRARVHA